MRNAKTNNAKLIKRMMGVGAALVIAFGVALTMKLNEKPLQKPKEDQSQKTENPAKDEPTAEKTDNKTPDEEPKQPELPEKTPPKYQGEVQESPKEIVGNIVTKRMIGDNLTINVMIREMIRGGGSCHLTLTERTNNKKVEVKNQIMGDVSTSHCESFKIPRDKLASGTWEIEIEMEAGQKKGKIKDEITL